MYKTVTVDAIVFFYINIYSLNQKIFRHTYICCDAPGNKKNIHIKYKKIQPKKNRKIKIIKNKPKKKTNKNVNFKCNINVKVMTSGGHQKSSALNLLVLIK